MDQYKNEKNRCAPAFTRDLVRLTFDAPSPTTLLGSSAYAAPTEADAQPSGAVGGAGGMNGMGGGGMASMTSNKGLGVSMKRDAFGTAALFEAGAASMVSGR